ncbi:alpha/beta hydrolase [Ramlibacter sp. G-1-2-2]|uniref:Alpha/beta hydrolase n=1 Tax=Ramlibacter agri TaxID=2728837 RepID=A0A848H444_9BURK|nr:alpha/beta hydrolase [Ramlibacter agri]NML45277.1 alpha/beta hydrolase [Ramlibacter agri]
MASLQRLGTMPAIRALQTRSGRLSFIVSGEGKPTLLLFNGAGVTLEGWRALYPQIEGIARVFAWNRFGLQGSDEPGPLQSGTVVLASLRQLLKYAGLKPPFVLVGHSLGGLYANLCARLYPDDVAGVLFLEAAHPDDNAMLQKHRKHVVRGLEKVQGLPQLLFESNVHAELDAAEETVREIASAGEFPPVPVRVISGGITPTGAMLLPGVIASRRANQQALAALSPLGEQVIAGKSGHFPQLSQPELVLEVLEELVESCRVT